MTESKNQTSPPLTAADIIDWLKAHPDFLSRNPEACDYLTLPSAHGGKGVADFQQYMMRRLREDRDTVIEEAREIVETSRANMSNQARIHRAILAMLDAQTFQDFIHTLIMDFVPILDVDIIAMVVETDGDAIPHINISGVHAVPPGTIALMTGGNRIVLESGIKGLSEIYGGGAGLVKSQILLNLHIAANAPPALLAFGSRDPAMFQPGQGTEMALFLGQAIERCFLRWLNLPR